VETLRQLAPFLHPYRWRYALGLCAVALTAGLSLLAPWILQRAIDDLGRAVTTAKLAAYGLALLGLALVGGTSRFAMRRIIIGISRHVECDIRDAFAGHLARLPLAFYQQRRTGDLMSRAMSDLEAVRLMIGISVIDAFNTIIVFVVAVALMLSIDARLTLVALAPLPLVSVSVKLFGAAIYRRFQAVQAQLAEVTAVTQEGLSAIRLIRAYGQEGTQLGRFGDATRLYFARNRSLIRLQAVFYATMTLLLGAGALLVLWLGSIAVVGGRMTLGQFVAFGAYQVMLGIPMIAFGSVTNTVQRGIASWRRMLEVFDAPEARRGPGPHEVRRAAGSGDLAPGRVGIEFRHLTFSYPGCSSPALHDVSFRVEPGETVALVGPTGSGKSTLLSLLPRLHEPPPGTVFADGADVRSLPLDELRAAIGFVPQEPFLFADTLVENIALASPTGYERRRWARNEAMREDPARGVDLLSGGVDLRGTGTIHLGLGVGEAVRRAAAISRLDADVPDLPQGYDTPLGERGLNLSGGQRQRTALARALVIDPAILVLDDALSAVDAKTEEEILQGLEREMHGRTSIIVSHRLATVRAADLILVFDEGRIVERGRHDELLRRGGRYAELHRKQALQEALAEA
jgi:ATP-binding cassette, subfamily B, multidrug efflux pump